MCSTLMLFWLLQEVLHILVALYFMMFLFKLIYVYCYLTFQESFLLYKLWLKTVLCPETVSDGSCPVLKL